MIWHDKKSSWLQPVRLHPHSRTPVPWEAPCDPALHQYRQCCNNWEAVVPLYAVCFFGLMDESVGRIFWFDAFISTPAKCCSSSGCIWQTLCFTAEFRNLIISKLFSWNQVRPPPHTSCWWDFFFSSSVVFCCTEDGVRKSPAEAGSIVLA